MERVHLRIHGIVQGVGFRPFIHKLVGSYGLTGYIKNTSSGVELELEGERTELERFVHDVPERAPKLAVIESVEAEYSTALKGFEGFEIRSSKQEAHRNTLISPDICICDDCLRELFDPNDRRYRYPFINCTNCGPRFTIIGSLPYGRPATSMKDFPMCERCAAEYTAPLDRRFHAQPDACFECGPHLSLAWRPDCEATPGEDFPTRGAGDVSSDELPDGWRIAWGKTRETSDALIARAVELLCAGQVVAVKGLGGFHLVCDARNAEAIARLREGKRRGGKPFAVMMANAEAARSVCEVTPEEEKALSDPARPIVLLKKRQGVALAAGLADKCQVQLAYAIGVAHPVSVLVETFGTGKVDDGKLEEAVEKVFDLRPTAIIRDLDLRRPIYRQLAAYGHMGREDLGVTWEKTDRVDALLAALK